MVHGQTPSPLPPGMTQDQFDAMVDAIGKAVVVAKLKNEGVVPAPRSAAARLSLGSRAMWLPMNWRPFLIRPSISHERFRPLAPISSSIPGLLDESRQGGRGLTRFLLLLALVAGVSSAAETIVRKSLGHFRHRLAAGTVPERGVGVTDQPWAAGHAHGLGVLAAWLIVTGAHAVLFSGSTLEDRFAAEVLTDIIFWRLFVWYLQSLLQPTRRSRASATSVIAKRG